MSTYHTRAQIGFELLITVALILVTLIIFFSINEKYLVEYDESYRYQKLQSSLDDLSVAMNSVYHQGVGAVGKVIIELPSGIKSNQIIGKSILYTLTTKGQDNTFEKTFEFAINGTLPVSPGKYEIVISSGQGYVQIEPS